MEQIKCYKLVSFKRVMQVFLAISIFSFVNDTFERILFRFVSFWLNFDISIEQHKWNLS